MNTADPKCPPQDCLHITPQPLKQMRENPQETLRISPGVSGSAVLFCPRYVRVSSRPCRTAWQDAYETNPTPAVSPQSALQVIEGLDMDRTPATR